MSALTSLQAVMHRVFRDELSLEDGARLLGTDPARLAIYRRFVHTHVRQAVEADFPRTLAALPPETRETLLTAYYLAHPPGHYDLDAAGEAFPDFLEAAIGQHSGLTGFHPALAQVEWEMLQAFRSALAVPDPATLARPVLNPTLTALTVPYPVVEYMMAGDGAAVPEALETPRTVLVLRHPVSETAFCYTATDDLLFALKVTYEGLDAREAARAAGIDEEAAEAAMRRGVGVGVVLGRANTWEA